MTKEEKTYLIEKVGILEETVATLLCYLRDNSNTTHTYVDYQQILSDATGKSDVAEKIYKTDKGYVKNG